MKIKSFIKKYYKRVVTSVLVCVSLFVFSISSLAVGYDDRLVDNFTYLSTFTYGPNSSPVDINEVSESFQWTSNTRFNFKFQTQYRTFDDNLMETYLAHDNGFYIIKFSFVLETVNSYTPRVNGFKYSSWNGSSDIDYNNVSWTINSISFQGSNFPSKQYNFQLIVPGAYAVDELFFQVYMDKDNSNVETLRYYTRKLSMSWVESESQLAQYTKPDTNITDDYHSKEESVLNDVGSDVGTVNGIFDNFNNIFNSGNIPTGLLAVTNVFNLIYQNGVITNLLWFSITIGAFAFILGVLPILNKGV